MSSLDVSEAHRVFLRTRLREAFLMLGLALLVSGFGLLLAEERKSALPYMALLLGLTFAFAYRGRSAGRAVLPALILGVLPLGCALAAQSVGHACTPNGCVSLCVPLCTAGGLGAGVLLARWAAAQKRPFVTWGAGAAVVAAAGAMGCACVGQAGILGMGGGLVATGALRALMSRTSA